jgi:hypothetical protein
MHPLTLIKLFIPLLIIQLSCTMEAQDFSGTYQGSLNGDAVTLNLQGKKNQYAGELNDGSNRYAVEATVQNKILTGTCKEVNLGFSFTMSGAFQGNTLPLKVTMMGITQEIVLQKTGTKASTDSREAEGNPSSRKEHDPQLVGTWTRQEQYNSGYGGGYMSNESSMIFRADGTMADAGSRTMVGGSGFSGHSGSGGGGAIPGLTWHTEGKNLYLTITENGKTQTQLLGRYGFHENAMMITGQDGTKLLFYRN